MNEKHTPGPWTACNEGKCRCKLVSCDDYPVAKVISGEWGDPGMPYGEVLEATAIANARLIAAAPTLLFAAEQAYAAIDLSLGEWRDFDVQEAPMVLAPLFSAKASLSAAIAKAKEVTP